MRAAYRYLRRNPSLALGLVLLAALGLFVLIGNLVVDTEDARPLSAPASINGSTQAIVRNHSADSPLNQ